MCGEQLIKWLSVKMSKVCVQQLNIPYTERFTIPLVISSIDDELFTAPAMQPRAERGYPVSPQGKHTFVPTWSAADQAWNCRRGCVTLMTSPMNAEWHTRCISWLWKCWSLIHYGAIWLLIRQPGCAYYTTSRLAPYMRMLCRGSWYALSCSMRTSFNEHNDYELHQKWQTRTEYLRLTECRAQVFNMMNRLAHLCLDTAMDWLIPYRRYSTGKAGEKELTTEFFAALAVPALFPSSMPAPVIPIVTCRKILRAARFLFWATGYENVFTTWTDATYPPNGMCNVNVCPAVQTVIPWKLKMNANKRDSAA